MDRFEAAVVGECVAAVEVAGGGESLWALGAGGSGDALRTDVAGWTLDALRSLKALNALGAGWTWWSRFADRADECAATRELIGLGHRRIVMLARPRRRLPERGASERAFLDELATGGVAPGPYHLPDWEESIEGFRMCLEPEIRS